MSGVCKASQAVFRSPWQAAVEPAFLCSDCHCDPQCCCCYRLQHQDTKSCSPLYASSTILCIQHLLQLLPVILLLLITLTPPTTPTTPRNPTTPTGPTTPCYSYFSDYSSYYYYSSSCCCC